MKARYQYRFYPSDQQRESLARLFGCVRVAWNDALAFCRASEKLPRYNELSAKLTQDKKTEARAWMSVELCSFAEVSAVPLQQALRHLDRAYQNFFNSRTGKRKGKTVGVPRFKKKSNQQSAEFTKAAFSVKDGQVYLAKIGTIQPIWSQALPSEPSSVTVIKDSAGRYFVSFVVDVQPIETQAENQSLGIDLGLKVFATMSNGQKAYSPDYSKVDRKIRKLQRKLARQEKGSKRRDRTRTQIAKLHNALADTRKDFLHKLSTQVVCANQIIVLEDLNVSGMVKNRKLSRAISLQGWRQFRVLCEAKAAKLNREFRVIDRWEPTSQVCSNCGFQWGKLDLSVRSVLCINCGTIHDRDENAAVRIEQVGMGHRHDSKRTSRDCKTASAA